MKGNAPAKIACIQMDVAQGEVDKNLEKAGALIREACGNGANLLVLPEMFNCGCVFENREQVYAVAEEVPGGKTANYLEKLAREHRVYIAGSLCELDGVDIYNTSILVGPEGYIGKYRKLHPCEDEVYWVEPGDLGIPVFHTPIGRIALLVCLDAYYPECFRIAALQGADIVCVSFNSMDVKKARGLPDPYYTMMPALCMANSLSNHIFVVGCNRTGGVGTVRFAGQSTISDQWGGLVTPMASHDREEILYAEVDLCDSRRKYFHPTNSRLANRRTDVYSADLGYQPEKYR